MRHISCSNAGRPASRLSPASRRTLPLSVGLIVAAALIFLLPTTLPLSAQEWDTDDASLEAIVEVDEEGDTSRFSVSVKTGDYRRYDDTVSMGTSLVIEEDEIVSGDAVNIGGPITVRGIVEGDAVAIGANIVISGTIEGDAVSVGGSIILEDDAEIDGDAVSVGGRVHRSPDSIVHGEVTQISFGGFDTFFPGAVGIITNPFLQRTIALFAKIFRIIVLIILALLVTAIFAKQTEVAAAAITEHFWKVLLIGILAQIVTVPLLIILAVIVIGIPLIPVVIVLVAAALILGYIAVACNVGRFAWRRFRNELSSPLGAAVIGVVLIELVSLLGRVIGIAGGPAVILGVIVSVVGFLIAYVAWTIGFGAALFTRFGTRPQEAAPVPASSIASPAPPAAPSDETGAGLL